jgi:hypothetical protein
VLFQHDDLYQALVQTKIPPTLMYLVVTVPAAPSKSYGRIDCVFEAMVDFSQCELAVTADILGMTMALLDCFIHAFHQASHRKHSLVSKRPSPRSVFDLDNPFLISVSLSFKRVDLSRHILLRA